MNNLFLIIALLLTGCAPDSKLFWDAKKQQSDARLNSLAPFNGERLVIGIIDSGFTPDKYDFKANLCENGHFDFTNYEAKNLSTPPEDSEEFGFHGSRMALNIMETLKGVDTSKYCLRIFKVYGSNQRTSGNISTVVRALELIEKENLADILNYSSESEYSDDQEKKIITTLLDKGVEIAVAAGNDGEIISETFPVYPAMYDPRLHVVGNPGDVSNWGEVINATAHGVKMWDEDCTSPATAVYSAEIAKRKLFSGSRKLSSSKPL